MQFGKVIQKQEVCLGTTERKLRKSCQGSVLGQKPECGTPLTQSMSSIDYSKPHYLFINLFTYHYTRGSPIFQKSRKHLKNSGHQQGDMKQIYTEGPQVFGAIVQNLFDMATWESGFVCCCMIILIVLLLVTLLL